jgi:protein-S-isoprenylcysteine O-methyltransferase Ste14
MASRTFVWLGGAIFVGSLALCAWWYLFVLGRLPPPAGWRPLVFDALLFTIFALHHSLFARDFARAWLHAIPTRLHRSVYVWVASLLLIGVCLLWRPIGGELYDATGFGAVALTAIQVFGVGFIARSVALIDPLELAGIRLPADSSKSDGLQTSGPFRWVRHPVYFGWLLAVFGTPHMTGDRLAFAGISCLYLAAAVPWEERSLVRSFGEDYTRYMREVKWRMIPFIY